MQVDRVWQPVPWPHFSKKYIKHECLCRWFWEILLMCTHPSPKMAPDNIKLCISAIQIFWMYKFAYFSFSSSSQSVLSLPWFKIFCMNPKEQCVYWWNAVNFSCMSASAIHHLSVIVSVLKSCLCLCGSIPLQGLVFDVHSAVQCLILILY